MSRARLQLVTLGVVSFVFTVVFAAVFAWVYTNATRRTTERLRNDLDETLRGAVASVDAEELAALARDGAPNPAGFSDDPRWVRTMALFEIVHRVEPRAWPYAFVRGGEGARRVGPKKAEPEFIYVADLWARFDATKAAKFLASDTGTEWSVRAFETGALVERPGIYTDAYGSWMTSYAPVRDLRGNVVAVMGVDFEASEVRKVQQDLSRALVLVFFVAYAATLALTYIASSLLERRKKRDAAPQSRKSVVVREEQAKPSAKTERRGVTVIRAEIVGVSELAATSTAVGVHHAIGDLLAAFDALARRHGLERIDTSHESYTVIGGLEGEASVDATRAMAFEMIDATAKHDGLSLRVGVHRGDVLVARTGMEHEIFGDAVRVAARLERSGEPGRVHASAAFAGGTADVLLSRTTGE